MRKLVMGCAVAGLIALSPKSEARSPALLGPMHTVHQVPKGEVGWEKWQIGWASWYGLDRQGEPTASGELFDKDGFTGAHRELPLGTTVRVTNLRNRKSTLLRINDRGPGMPRRVLDVSWAAAQRLGFLRAGLTPVEIDVVSYPISDFWQLANSSSPKVN